MTAVPRRGEYRTPSCALWFRREQGRGGSHAISRSLFPGHALSWVVPKGHLLLTIGPALRGDLWRRILRVIVDSALDAVVPWAANLLAWHVRGPS